MAQGSSFPAQAKSGQCFKQITTPAQYTTVQKQVLTKQESKSISVIPAKYETVTETITVKEASNRLVQVPATYKWVTEQVLDKPAFSKWVKDPSTGIMCKKEVEAAYRTVKRKEVDVAAHTKSIEIAAVTKTVPVRKVLEPAREVVKVIPAEYKTLTETKLVSDAASSWDQVVCRTNSNTPLVGKIQEVLRSKGYYKGPMDSILGSMTFNAAKRFAKDNNLAGGNNFMTLKTVSALGINTANFGIDA